MFKLFVHVDERSCYSSHTTSSAAGNFRSRPSVSFAIPSLENDFDGGFTMAKGRRPPPLNLSIDARPRSLPRISRTPANKEATPLLTPLPEDDYEDPPEPIVRAVRIAVDFMHLVACMMLVLMMAIFMATSSQAITSSYGTKALLLVIALAGDVVLDMRSINLHDQSWSDWALVARSISSSVYLGILISFLAAERVFPVDYTYWNLVPEEAGEPVLALLCVVLGWDIVHLILSQRRAGWWWIWARAQCQRGPNKIGGGGVMGGWDRNRGGRAPRRTMRGWTWSCAS